MIWPREVKFLIADILDGKTNGHAATPALVSAYDFFYRVCNGGPCYDYLRKVKLKIVDRWLKGDNSISDTTDVVLLLLSEADRAIRFLEKRYLITHSAFWVNGLTSLRDTYMVGYIGNLDTAEQRTYITFARTVSYLIQDTLSLKK